MPFALDGEHRAPVSDALVPERTATVKGVTAASDLGHPSKRAADTGTAWEDAEVGSLAFTTCDFVHS